MNKIKSLATTALLMAFALTAAADLPPEEAGPASDPTNPEPSAEHDRALVQAAFDGELATVKAAMQKGASVEAKAPKGRTSIHWAAVNGHLDVIEFLHAEGADLDASDGGGMTPLMFAVKGKHADVVAFLLENGAEVNARSIKIGLTPLTIAAAVGNVDVVRILLSHGADLELPERSGDTALDRARQYEHPDVAALLEAGNTASGS